MKRSVLVTGGCKRLGKAIGDAFAEAGWTVVRSTHDFANAASVDIFADLRASIGAQWLMEMAQMKLKRKPDVLVNNAALYVDAGTDEEIWQVNYHSPKLLAEAMSGGIVVNICDKFAATRHPGTAYAESKEALAAWSKEQGHVTIEVGDIIDLAPEGRHEKAMENAPERLTSKEIACRIVAAVQERLKQ